MTKNNPKSLPASIAATLDLLSAGHYVGDRPLATVLFLALKMGRPLFLEGEAGVGKTEIAKVLSETLGRRLIRLQCYEGLDVSAAVYEWNYAAQMIAIRLGEAEGNTDRERLEHDVFSERFLIKRPLLQALEPDPAGAPVLLIDELDRTDEAFEAFLLEVLAKILPAVFTTLAAGLVQQDGDGGLLAARAGPEGTFQFDEVRGVEVDRFRFPLLSAAASCGEKEEAEDEQRGEWNQPRSHDVWLRDERLTSPIIFC